MDAGEVRAVLFAAVAAPCPQQGPAQSTASRAKHPRNVSGKHPSRDGWWPTIFKNMQKNAMRSEADLGGNRPQLPSQTPAKNRASHDTKQTDVAGKRASTRGAAAKVYKKRKETLHKVKLIAAVPRPGPKASPAKSTVGRANKRRPWLEKLQGRQGEVANVFQICAKTLYKTKLIVAAAGPSPQPSPHQKQATHNRNLTTPAYFCYRRIPFHMVLSGHWKRPLTRRLPPNSSPIPSLSLTNTENVDIYRSGCSVLLLAASWLLLAAPGFSYKSPHWQPSARNNNRLWLAECTYDI